MPLYEYVCQGCGTAFEKIRKYDERTQPTACPSCASEDALPAFSAPGRVGLGSSSSAATLPSTGTGGGCASGACGLW